jgi:hypothetical protein
LSAPLLRFNNSQPFLVIFVFIYVSDSFVGNQIRVSEPRLSLVWCVIWWSGEGELSKVVLGRASMWAVASLYCLQRKPGSLNWVFGQPLFSWNSVLAQKQFLQGGGMFCIHLTRPPCPHTGWISSGFHTTPNRQRWNFSSIYLTTSFVQGGCNLPTSCTELCKSLQSRLCVALTWQDCDFTQWNPVSSRMAQAGKSPKLCIS